MNRIDFQQLADLRIAEAAALLALPMPDAAYYLAGYAIECALKACIARLNQQHDWPEKDFVRDCHTHNILNLVRLAGLDIARSSDVEANPALALNWNIVKDWNERSRYERHSLPKAEKMLLAVTDNENGVLPWIRVRW